MTTTLPAPVGTRPRAARGLLVILLGGQMMASIDGSIVNVALPDLGARLGASGAELQLIPAAYLLSFAALMVTAARLGDRYGHTRAYRTGLAGFTAASLACGLAPDAPALIAFRLVQGAFSALMVAQVVSLLHRSFDGVARTRAIAGYSLVLALGVAAGQILGGAIVALDVAGLGWRPIFLVNVPIGIAVAAAARRLPGNRPDAPASRLDLAGAILLGTAASAIVAALSLGRHAGWPAWSLTALAVGAGGMVAFSRYEWRLVRAGREPLLDPRAVRPVGVRPGLAACYLVMGCYGAFVFTLTLYLQTARGFGPLRAGMTFVPFALGFALTSRFWMVLPERISRVLPVAGPAAFATGATLVAFPQRWHTAPAVALLLFAGAGHAASFSPLFARISSLVAPAYASALSALANTGTLLAGAIAVAGLGGVYLSAPTGHAGLLRVVLGMDVVLAVAATCAARTVFVRQAGAGAS